MTLDPSEDETFLSRHKQCIHSVSDSSFRYMNLYMNLLISDAQRRPYRGFISYICALVGHVTFSIFPMISMALLQALIVFFAIYLRRYVGARPITVDDGFNPI